jgi:hypothetical protein
MYMYIHVHAVPYLYVHGINMSVSCSDTYVPFCPILSRWVGFQMTCVGNQECYIPCATMAIVPGDNANHKREVLDEDVLEECGQRVIRHGFEVRHSPLVGS